MGHSLFNEFFLEHVAKRLLEVVEDLHGSIPGKEDRLAPAIPLLLVSYQILKIM